MRLLPHPVCTLFKYLYIYIIVSLGIIKDSARPTYWVPDHLLKECAVCKNEFGPKLSKHHCRSCGEGVCDGCSKSRKAVPSRGWNYNVRVCNNCIANDSF